MVSALFLSAPGQLVKKITSILPIDISRKFWYTIIVPRDSEKVTESVANLFCEWSATPYERTTSQSVNLVEASYRGTFSG